MTLINGRFVSQETFNQLRDMTDAELVAFRDANQGWYHGLVDAANLEIERRNGALYISAQIEPDNRT